MGKDLKRKHQGGGNRQPYNKNGWKSRRTDNNGPKQNNGYKRDSSQPAAPKVSLREDQVGITEYINGGPGFTGVLKSRFSDFHVNEIDLNGKVLQLTSLDIPQPPEDEPMSAEELTSLRAELSGIVDAEWWQSLDSLADADAEAENKPIEVDVSILDKDTRTKIHKIIKQIYKKRLVSTTLSQEQDQKKLIRVLKAKQVRDRNEWKFPGEFVHFLVHKENMDTIEAAAALAGNLRMRTSMVSYCGTKDKRGKTTQKFCIKRRSPSQIVGSIKKVRNLYIGNFEFSSEVLKLGQLKGNRFRIALRHVKGEKELIEARLQQLRDHGFINYYGLQRFGNCSSIPTYEIGVALLKSDYKLACELILKPRDNDIFFLREVREHWWKHRDSAKAAAMIHGRKFIEKMLLEGLAQCGEKDYATALRRIPRNMLLLYPHAFQSLVFNTMASRRIKEFGLELIPGDLVFKDKDVSGIEEVLDVPIEDPDEEGETEREKNVGEQGSEKTDAKSNGESEVSTAAVTVIEESVFKNKVKALTAEDIASQKYTIFDVVLPLPGFDITYPNNAVGTWYEEMLQSHDLSSEKLRHNVKTFAMAGAYRKLLIKPEEMSWEFRQYKHKDETLIASDIELLKPNDRSKISNDGEGEFTALLLNFNLSTSAYATMLLRELLKEDTSAGKQTELEQIETNNSKPAKKDAAPAVPKFLEVLPEKA